MPRTTKRRNLWPNDKDRMSAADYAIAERFGRMPTEFGRAIDREEIQDAPIGPANPPVWRMLAVISICWLLTGFALVGAFIAARGLLRLLGVL